MSNIAAYIFSAYSFISNLPLEQLLDVGNSAKNGIPIPSFTEDILIKLCQETRDIFKNENNVLEIKGDLIVVGDVHGSFHDLLRILKYVTEKRCKVLFLGDYIDRGHFSLECITILFVMKVLRPNDFFLIRGNHEFDSICSKYGFKNEILNYSKPKKKKEKKKIGNFDNENIFQNGNEYQLSSTDCSDRYQYTGNLYRAFIRAFSYMPIAAIVNKSTFCIHGGLSPQLQGIDLLDFITRPINSFGEDILLTDILWSDPSSFHLGSYRPSHRGHGYLYNESAVTKFLNENSFKRIIRAHQFIENGISEHFGKKCITVFSASSYSCDMGNESGILKINQYDDSIQYKIFQPIRRLHKSKALYYRDVPKKPLCYTMRHPTPVFKAKTSRVLKEKNVLASSSTGKISKIQRDLGGLKINCHINPALIVNKRPAYPLIRTPTSQRINKSISMPNIDQLTDDIYIASDL